MPWKKDTPMDQRVRFIAKVNESDDESFTEICRQFGISRKTGYKWIERYEKEGAAGLMDRAPVARSCPHKTSVEMLTAILELRKEYPSWGPKKLRARLAALGHESVPSASTIGEQLKKHGLNRPRRRRVFPPLGAREIAEAPCPNDVWCVDFKGHFGLGDKTRCHPLTMSDLASRYLLKCEGLHSESEESTRPHFERAFREFGLPLRIRSDNGSPFASVGVGGLSRLSIWWVKLGIGLERIEPGHPEQNGAHERMHKTLEEAVEPPQDNLREQQVALDRFRRIFNEERPHEALGQKTPATKYSRSSRTMPSEVCTPEYPASMIVRKISPVGRMALAFKTVYISRLLVREDVGLQEIDDGKYRLFFGSVLLGDIVVGKKELKFSPVR